MLMLLAAVAATWVFGVEGHVETNSLYGMLLLVGLPALATLPWRRGARRP